MAILIFYVSVRKMSMPPDTRSRLRKRLINTGLLNHSNGWNVSHMALIISEGTCKYAMM